MTTHLLERVQRIPRPRSQVFAFFADAGNLERITPGFLNFRILTPQPIEMKAGALIDYQLSLYGVPLSWRTRIETFDPEDSFSDVQLSGPYRSWHHRHEFKDDAGGTEMRDVVRYELPLGPLGSLARVLFVRRSLERIFDHRRQVIADVFPA
ncbi:MAG: SRPBCC family protein [Polyangiaceae bacterium]